MIQRSLGLHLRKLPRFRLPCAQVKPSVTILTQSYYGASKSSHFAHCGHIQNAIAPAPVSRGSIERRSLATLARNKVMKKKKKRLFECSACGATAVNWTGQCSKCGAWDTIMELSEDQARVLKEIDGGRRTSWGGGAKLETVRVCAAVADTREEERVRTGLDEFDRAIGGGFVRGSFVLVGGEPGVGKSTLVLQLARALGKNGRSVLYVSGEESTKQVIGRSRRLGDFPENVRIGSTSSLEVIEQSILDSPVDVLVIDSVQTLATVQSQSAPGSVSQIREVTAGLLPVAKDRDTIVILVGHVLKDGSIAGPRTMEHMVDVVLYFESSPKEGYKLLRNHKNRFGSTSEIGLFEMSKHGLLSVTQPGSFFYDAPHLDRAIGSCATCSLEGSRAFLCEVQALVVSRENTFGPIVRRSIGIHNDRAVLISAVMEKYLKRYIAGGDLYVNCAGGGQINDKGADLSICGALLSSSLDIPLLEKTALFGEIGLAGEIRPITNLSSRADAAMKMGIKTVVVPMVGEMDDAEWKRLGMGAPLGSRSVLQHLEGEVNIVEVGHVSDLMTERLFPELKDRRKR